MHVIRLAVDFDKPRILAARNGAHIGVEALPPLQVNGVPAPFGAPDHVKKYGKIFSCHILSNGPAPKMAEKISAICAAPSALVSFAIPNPGLTAGPSHFRPFGPHLHMYKLQAWGNAPGVRYANIVVKGCKPI